MPSHLRAIAPLPATESSTQRIAVVVAERHAHMRRTLSEVIDADDGLVLVGDAHDLASAEIAMQASSSRVLVVDRGLLDSQAIGDVARLCERVLPARVVVLSSEVIPSLADRILGAGASGFVLKEHADVELPAAVRAAAHGQAFMSSGMRPSRAHTATAGFPTDDRGVLRISPAGRTR